MPTGQVKRRGKDENGGQHEAESEAGSIGISTSVWCDVSLHYARYPDTTADVAFRIATQAARIEPEHSTASELLARFGSGRSIPPPAAPFFGAGQHSRAGVRG